MTERASNLLQLALELSEEERAELVSSLLDSLDPSTEQNIQQAWDEEIGRRVAEIESGTAETVPWPEVQRRLSSKLPNAK